MLSILFNFAKKNKQLEKLVPEIQAGDETLREELIQNYKPFIGKAVSKVCKRYIDDKDDEFSIGIIAFNEALDHYSIEKGGSLLGFAELLIKRKVIDYIRKEVRHQYITLDNNHDDEDDFPQNPFEAKKSLETFHLSIEQEQRREEIIHFQSVLKEFSMTLNELIDSSPKHTDARLNAISIAKAVANDAHLREALFRKKRLPVKDLEKMVSVSRKTIERNRKYIIAMSIIMTGDYLYLKDYLKGVLEH